MIYVPYNVLTLQPNELCNGPIRLALNLSKAKHNGALLYHTVQCIGLFDNLHNGTLQVKTIHSIVQYAGITSNGWDQGNISYTKCETSESQFIFSVLIMKGFQL